MSREFTYIRKYIILQNDYTNIKNINPKGYGKIEVRGIKGVMSLSIENCQEDEEYRVCFLKDIDGQVKEQDLGRILTDERGKSRTNIKLNLRDLEWRGFSIDEIDAILIRRGIDIVLAGYIEKDNGAIDRFIKQLISEENQESIYTEEMEAVEEIEPFTEEVEEELLIEESPEPIEVESIEEVKEPKPIEDEEEVKIEEAQPIEDEEEVKIEEAQPMEDEKETNIEGIHSMEDIQEINIEEIESIEDIEKEIEPIAETKEEVDSKETAEYDTTTEALPNYQSLEYTRRLNHKNQMTNYILSILRFFPQVQPLRMYLHGYSWWKIEDGGREPYKGFLPYYNYLMSTNYRYPFLDNSTTCSNLIRKYGHYLFGMYKEREEVKYYIYGVPGKFTIGEKPFKGVTGFNTWYESTEGLGYWIIYIDPMTGKIIHPINPMVPKD